MTLWPSSIAATCSSMGYSMGHRWISAPLWTFMGCKGTASLSTVFSRGCRGASVPLLICMGCRGQSPVSADLCSSASPHLPPHWPCCPHSYSSQMPLVSKNLPSRDFSPLDIPEALPPWLIGSALPRSGFHLHTGELQEAVETVDTCSSSPTRA